MPMPCGWLVLLATIVAAPAWAGEPVEAACPTGGWWHYPRVADGLDNAFVNDIDLDARGDLYLATNAWNPVETMGGGISVLHPDGDWSLHRHTEGGLNGNTVFAVATAGEDVVAGTLWGASVFRRGEGGKGGWSRLPEEPEDGFPLDDVVEVLADPDGGWWFACSSGLYRWKDGLWRRWDLPQGRSLTASAGAALAWSPDGRLWVGTRGSGIGVLDPESGGWEVHSAAVDGLPVDHVNVLAFDGRGRAWAGTGVGVAVLDDGSWTTLSTRNSPLTDDDVRAIEVDARGRIWLGTNRGLTIVDGDRWHRCGPVESLARPPSEASAHPGGGAVDGLPHPMITAIRTTDDGTVWLGTFGGGLVRFREESP